MDCINLRSRYGDRYRIRHDESYAAERTDYRSAEEAWLQLIPCDHGHIYPAGGDRLAVSTDRRGPVAQRIRRLPFIEVLQDGSDGLNATFPVDRFDDVAAIMQPKRRKRLSAEHRAKLVAAGQAYRFHGSKDAPSGLERAQTVPVEV